LANHYLVIGPYDHSGAGCGYIQPVLGGYTLDDVANINIDSLIYQWFDYTLKGGRKPGILQDTVNYEVMGANRWEHVPSLKKVNSSFLDLYLSDTKQGKYYNLATQKSGGSVSQYIDFSIRKERNVSYSLNTSGVLTDSLSDDIITFISDVQKDDFIISGSFIANLSASINKKDMDIVIALTVQQPDGKYLNLSSALIRASYAKSYSQRNLLTPGVKENIPVNGAFASVKVLKGSRIIVSISALGSGPYLEINYGTGADVATENIKNAKQPLQINWYGDSVIQIPINK
jgi:predicted acyl esterase